MATAKRDGVKTQFGADKGVQRNKDNVAGEKPNRSPGRSNANRMLPSLREDVIPSAKDDAKRIVKSVTPNDLTGASKIGVKKAGIRAASRMAARAIPAVGAGLTAYDVTSAVIEGSKGKDNPENRLKSYKAAKAATTDMRKGRSAGVEAGAREEAMKSKPEKKVEKSKPEGSFKEAFAAARKSGAGTFSWGGKKYSTEMAKSKKEEDMPKSSVREGRNANIDDGTRKKAMASVANLAKGGMAKKMKR